MTEQLDVWDKIEFYHKMIEEDENARYKSWEHCYYVFFKARQQKEPDYDYLALNLAFYLASWGMYRGSSFLLQQDYKIHIEAVKKILKPEYNVLLGISCVELASKLSTLKELKKELEEHYKSVRSKVISNSKNKTEQECKESANEISSTLVTKILMGTLGCVPAYDRYFIEAVKRYNITTGVFNENSIKNLIEFYENNKQQFSDMKENYKIKDIPYPEMKLLDMAFWQLGFELTDGKKKNGK